MMRSAQGWRWHSHRVDGCNVRAQLGPARARELLGRWLQLLVLALNLMLLAPLASSDVRYVYDAAGRVVQVVAPDGSSAHYRYDPAGNIVAIDRIGSSEFAFTAFSPTTGSAGTQVKLFGSGFSTTLSANTVSFNGAAASVIAATANELIVVVPTAASTGPISVSVAGNSLTSSDTFVLTVGPSISGFSPKVVNQGGSVTVTGTALEPVAGETQVAVGRWLGVPVAYSDTSLAFTLPPNARSGAITVTTPQGRVSTAEDLIVVPPAVPAGSVAASAQLNIGAAPSSLTFTGSTHGIFAVRGEQGEYLSVQLSSLTNTPSNQQVGYQIYSPTNTPLASGTVSASNMSIHLPKIVTSGTHLVVFSGDTNATVNIAASVEASPVLTGAEAPLAVATTVNSQSKRFIMRANAGDDMGVGISQLVTAPINGGVIFSVTSANGEGVGSASGCHMGNPGGSCNWWDVDVPFSGDYIINVGASNSTATFKLTVSKALTATLTPSVAVPLNIQRAGQIALLEFTVGPSGTVALHLGSVLTSPANQTVGLEVIDQAGASVPNGSSSSAGSQTRNLRNLAAGTYRAIVNPWYGVTAAADIVLAPGLAHAVAADAVTRAFSTSVPGQVGYFTFAATAGDDIGIGISSLTTIPSPAGNTQLQLFAPNGSPVEAPTSNCFENNPAGSCNLWKLNLPQTGIYQIVVTPPAVTINFNLTVSRPVGGAIASGITQTMTAAPGQIGVYTFTATAGQNAAASISSVATTPVGQNLVFAVYGPNGQEIKGGSGPGTQLLNVTDLTAGTHRIVVVPWYGVRATAQVTYADAPNTAVPVDGVSRHFTTSVLGQSSYFTFTATAGQHIGVGVANFSATPASGGSLSLVMYQSNGAQVTSSSCSTSNPQGRCNLWALNVPQTGTYRLIATPGQALASFDLTISQAVSGTLVAGVAQPVNIPSDGQFAVYTFNATAGQNASINLSSLTTSPSGIQASLELYNPSYGSAGGTWGAGNLSLNPTNLVAGTYRVVVVPWYGVPAAAQLLYQ